MPGYLVEQPDGKWARWSSIVDDFTDFDMDEQEAIQSVVTSNWTHPKSIAEIREVKGERWFMDWDECLKLRSAFTKPEGGQRVADKIAEIECRPKVRK